jgi:hypothetical protein
MNGIWVWTVPFTRTYTFVVTGSPNGASRPAVVTATCPINAGTYVYMIIGQQQTATGGTNGSGGTFVFIGTQTLFTSYTSLVNNGTVQTPLIAAGGAANLGAGAGNPSASLTSSGNVGSGNVAGGANGANGSGLGGIGVLNLLSASGLVGSCVGGGTAASGVTYGGGGGYSGGGGSTNGLQGPGGGGSEVLAGSAITGVRGLAVKGTVTLATLATSTSSGYSLTNGSVVIS